MSRHNDERPGGNQGASSNIHSSDLTHDARSRRISLLRHAIRNARKRGDAPSVAVLIRWLSEETAGAR